MATKASLVHRGDGTPCRFEDRVGPCRNPKHWVSSEGVLRLSSAPPPQPDAAAVAEFVACGPFPTQFYSDAAVDRIVNSAGVPLARDNRLSRLSEDDLRASLRADLNFLAGQLVREVRTEERRTGLKSGRPRDEALERFMTGLHALWMTRFDRLLAGRTDSSLMLYLEASCQELRAAFKAGVPGAEDVAVRIIHRLEVREYGLTRRALRSRVQRGVWLRIAKPLPRQEEG